MQHSFFNDYSSVGHPDCLQALIDAQSAQYIGYGTDPLSDEARDMVRSWVQRPDADIHFVPGGTQANIIMTAASLSPVESLILPESGHPHVHECGAIANIGRTIQTLPVVDGKVTVRALRDLVARYEDEHTVIPRMLLVAQATELGSIYRLHELEALSQVCWELGLLFAIDGARLAVGLTSSVSDASIADIARLTDIFSIGGTKIGAILGEAIVVNNPLLKKNFRHYIKQNGALMAKGFILASQFVALMRDRLYEQLGTQTNARAEELTQWLKKLDASFLSPPEANLVYPILKNSVIAELQKDFGFYIWSKVDDQRSAIRLVTAWDTTSESIADFLKTLTLLTK